jgi:importin subunit beta-1
MVGGIFAQTERNIIMTVVCDGVTAPQPDLRRVFYECLVKIATLYYDKLGQYIQTIFNVHTTLSVY